MMNNVFAFIKLLPGYLLRFAHVIKHLFCDIDECEEDSFED